MVTSDTGALAAATGSSGTTGDAAVGVGVGPTVPCVGFGCTLGLGFGSFLGVCTPVPLADGFGDLEVEGGPAAGVGGGDGSAGD